MTAPAWVRLSAGSPARAIPKSVTFTWLVVMSTLPGLTSRWITPCTWAKCRAAAMSAPISAARVASSGPCRRMTSRSVSPSTYSMTMKYVPSSSPQS